LELTGLRFSVFPPGIAEPPKEDGESVSRHTERLARMKAGAVSEAIRKTGETRDFLVIAADTVVFSKGKVYGKPADGEDALRMLRALSGRKHSVVTGICVEIGEIRRVRSVESKVSFKKLSEADLRKHLETGEHEGKAGAYAAQGPAGRLLISDIKGSYTNVMGLPLEETLDAIRRAEAAWERRGKRI
jgi:septum formation protein